LIGNICAKAAIYLAGVPGELREKGLEVKKIILSGPVVAAILEAAAARMWT